MLYTKIPMQAYENFHKIFSGSNQNTFEICSECGGACEHNKIGTLLPGEEEYMAEKMGINVSEFKIRYLDAVEMDDGTLIYVLKLGKLCPFLCEENEECKCRDFKPIFCKIYPLVLTLEDNKINFTMDNWCKLSRKKACRLYFETAIPLLSSLEIPIEWLRHVTSYDNLCFDYDQLKEYRRGKNKYATFLLEELLSLQKAEIETISLCADFSQDLGQKVEEPVF
ncbi:YkgJ family cysteine cluster protein [Methanosarcina barkeri]|nr:YkgJ family cysteine cluster protein [Methanosarcina barkeri]